MCTQLTHLPGFARSFIYGKANKRLAVVTQTDCAANDIFGICPVAQNWYLVFIQWNKIGIWYLSSSAKLIFVQWHKIGIWYLSSGTRKKIMILFFWIESRQEDADTDSESVSRLWYYIGGQYPL